jgi:transcriptional regulator with XRE-family HTH domain
MANRQSVAGEASRFAQWLLRDAGRELRVARLVAGMTQREVGMTLRRAPSHVSRVEHGAIPGIGLHQLSRHAAAVGLKPYLRFYPVAARPLDRAQLDLIARFRARLASSWTVVLEAPMPATGDLRAADALIAIPGCRIVVEAITRLADVQAQLRSARRKVRDLDADRLVFVVAATSANRRAVADAGGATRDAFPVGARTALRRLADGRDPGGDALILVARADEGGAQARS